MGSNVPHQSLPCRKPPYRPCERPQICNHDVASHQWCRNSRKFSNIQLHRCYLLMPGNSPLITGVQARVQVTTVITQIEQSWSVPTESSSFWISGLRHSISPCGPRYMEAGEQTSQVDVDVVFRRLLFNHGRIQRQAYWFSGPGDVQSFGLEIICGQIDRLPHCLQSAWGGIWFQYVRCRSDDR